MLALTSGFRTEGVFHRRITLTLILQHLGKGTKSAREWKAICNREVEETHRNWFK